MACHRWPSADVVCHDCWQRFAHAHQRCTGCALALPGLSAEHPVCGQCLRDPKPWQHAYAWMDYAYPWSQLITQWKFAQQPALARHFARWMRSDPHIAAMLEQADWVVPVPMSAQRLGERGYNQAALLSQHLTPHKYCLHVLLRTHLTPAQSASTRAQRLRQLRHAFAVAPSERSSVEGRRIVLVDDVMTTGATMAAASRCLLQAGARQVQVLSLARTP